MAKKRQGIHAIQAALLSHTQHIGSQDEPQEAAIAPAEEAGAVPEAPPACAVVLDPDLHRTLVALARYQQTTVEALVALAVEDLLALRHRQVKAALEEA